MYFRHHMAVVHKKLYGIKSKAPLIESIAFSDWKRPWTWHNKKAPFSYETKSFRTHSKGSIHKRRLCSQYLINCSLLRQKSENFIYERFSFKNSNIFVKWKGAFPNVSDVHWQKGAFTITSNSNSSNATVKKSAAPFQGFNFGGFFLLAEKIGRLASN